MRKIVRLIFFLIRLPNPKLLSIKTYIIKETLKFDY